MGTRRSSVGSIDGAFSVFVAVWLFVVIVTGGITIPSPGLWAFHVVSSLLLLMWSLLRLRGGFPTGISAACVALLVAGLCLTFLQLVPLSSGLWNKLPGRELVSSTYAAAKIPQPALPLTLSPRGTLEASTAFVFALAAFCSALTLPRRGIIAAFVAILAAASLSVILAVLQKAQGQESSWYLYGGISASSPSGTFGNRNFFAAQVFTSIPILGALATTLHEELRIRKLILNIFILVGVCLLLAGLAVSGSRAGIFLAMISLMMTIFFVYRPTRSGGLAGSAGAAAIAILLGILVLGQASMIGFLRMADVDPLSDYRWTIFAVTKRAITSFFPFGSGFGSFVPVYQMFEKPGEVIDAYANHAHNEWLEVALEGGLPAILLLAGGVVLLFASIFRLINADARSTTKVLQWAALVVVLLFMAHATVDFGTRTPALMAVLAICCGIVSLAGKTTRFQSYAPSRESVAMPGRKQEPASFRSARGSFERNPRTDEPKH